MIDYVMLLNEHQMIKWMKKEKKEEKEMKIDFILCFYVFIYFFFHFFFIFCVCVHVETGGEPAGLYGSWNIIMFP